MQQFSSRIQISPKHTIVVLTRPLKPHFLTLKGQYWKLSNNRGQKRQTKHTPKRHRLETNCFFRFRSNFRAEGAERVCVFSPAMDLPECPVCLQTYDDHVAVPRVLSCGHTVCEACLVELPERYPNTIRCPACTQLVKFSSQQGPSSLPKNIDLLRLCLQHSPHQSQKPNHSSTNNGDDHDRSVFHTTPFWSDEFYAAWKDWILPNDAVLVERESEPEAGRLVLRGKSGSSSSLKGRVKVFFSGNKSLSLVPVTSLPVDSSKFRFSYVARIMKCLEGMTEVAREELSLILEASVRQGKVCRVYGLWSEVEVVDGSLTLYLVSERHSGSLFDNLGELRNGDGLELDKDGLFRFAMIGRGVCESVLALHMEGLIAGCLGFSCFSFDELDGIYVDLNGVFVMGRKILDAVSEGTSYKHKEEAMYKVCLQNELFISPEVLFKLLHKGAITSESVQSSFSIGYRSDVWSLACALLRLLVGNALPQNTLQMNEENCFDYSAGYICWVEKVSSVLEERLGSKYLSLRQTLCKCLDINPAYRPDVVDVRKCILDLLVKPQYDFLSNLEVAINRTGTDRCLILGEFCRLPIESSMELRECELQEKGDGGQPDCVQAREEKSDDSFVVGLSKGMTELKDLQGHLDCITGLTVGGGYLFSSSFDKTVHVWSLQDFSHLHTFSGHENKVMALVYVDDKEPLCISGDSGGGIFVWGVTTPLREDPLRKWNEQKDWRFSGIHSLTVSKNLGLYTGSGDRTIKAWSMDGTLICTMSGHRSVVSTLEVCDEVLYSGSWDGTVRLWSLNDHSPLTVLGEDLPGQMKSVLAITANRHLLVAAYENGCIKVWRNDVFMSSKTLHNGAIFAMAIQGKCLYTGGWDKNINIQELSGDEFELDVEAFGSISCSSVVTTILCSQGKLFVGFADKSIKVYQGRW